MIPTNPFSLPSLTGVDSGIDRTVLAKLPLLYPVPDSPDDYILKLDNSTMEVFQTCPRSAFYYCISRRTRVGRAALIFGGGIHAALEHMYTTSFADLRESKLACLHYMEAQDFNPGNDWRTPELALITLEQYFNYYSLMDNIKPLIINGKPFVEQSFDLEIGEFSINDTLPFTYSQLGIPSPTPDERVKINKLHLHWTGKIDILGYIGDTINVIDHKTTSMGGDTFFNDFTLSQQTIGYAWAAQHIINQPVNNFTVNALIIRKPTKTGKGTEFDRRTCFYPPAFLEEWQRDIYAACESFVFSMLHNSFPKHTKWCMGKYGACQFHPVCSSLPSGRDFVLSTDQYANVTWSPLL
jgi:hypothetical protein